MPRRDKNAAEGLVLKAIAAAARRNEPCPTNDQFAAMLGYQSPGTVAAVVRTLERRGVLLVERGHMSRVATIVETGERTAGTIEKPRWRLGDPPRTKPAPVNPKVKIAIEDMPQAVFRDACTYCGVRGDVGCKHQRLV